MVAWRERVLMRYLVRHVLFVRLPATYAVIGRQKVTRAPISLGHTGAVHPQIPLSGAKGREHACDDLQQHQRLRFVQVCNHPETYLNRVHLWHLDLHESVLGLPDT